ncbi:MAG: hypothetical protein WCP69_13400 [Bacteroidota bacterium]
MNLCKIMVVLFVLIILNSGCKKDDSNELSTIVQDSVMLNPSLSETAISNESKTIFLNINIDPSNDLKFIVETRSGDMNQYMSKVSMVEVLTSYQIAVDMHGMILCLNTHDRCQSDSMLWTYQTSRFCANEMASYAPAYNHTSGDWNNRIDKYMQLRKVENNDTLYSWIKMSVIGFCGIEIKGIYYERKSK